VDIDPTADYPLGAVRPDAVRTHGGLSLDELTLDALRAGALSSEEMRATPETLRAQAAVASAAGRRQLAENLLRAAELASVGDDVILEIYTALRPHRSTPEELQAWEERLEIEHHAPLTAAFVREARTVYAERGLLSSASERAETPTL
jgi:propanediol dehydratase small subunit